MIAPTRYLEPGPLPAPGAQVVDRIVCGFMQPILGARLLVRDRLLRRAALVPVGFLAAFCLLLALDKVNKGGPAFLRDFYKTFAVLAPLPSVLMRGHYARLVMRARACFGLPLAKPYVEPLWQAGKRALLQAILIAVAIAPASALFGLLPVLGTPLVRAAAAIWALHWIVIDAFEATRVLRPVEPDADQPPWFVRGLCRFANALPMGGWPFRWFARICNRLARPWHEDIAALEAHPAPVLGFALATAALLATPVLNLFFRPVVLIGAVHLLGRSQPAGCPPALAPLPDQSA
jgi:hypothetical protein